jgi:hypothetical protein
MLVMGIPKFERFFRAAAGPDVSKNDLKRYNDLVDAKLHDLFLIGTAGAKANSFQKLEEGIELRPLLDQLAAHPALGMDAAEETQQRLPSPATPAALHGPLGRSLRTVRPADLSGDTLLADSTAGRSSGAGPVGRLVAPGSVGAATRTSLSRPMSTRRMLQPCSRAAVQPSG